MVDSNKPIRVLIVDDSFFVRNSFQTIIDKNPGIKVVGMAKDGDEALLEAERLKPDVIIMDFYMSKTNGVEVTKLILKKVNPKPAILLSYSREDSRTLEISLKAGAVSCVPKPLDPDLRKVEGRIMKEIQAASVAHVERMRLFDTKEKEGKKLPYRAMVKLIVIGASTGGPPVIERLLDGLPKDFACAILVVQHMPGSFTKNFAKRLDKITYLQVSEASEGDKIQSGKVFVAPSDLHMVVESKEQPNNEYEYIIHLTKEEPVSDVRPSIDETLKTVSEHFGEKAIGIILTGMGEDGLEGIKELKRAGGYVIAQMPETCVVDSMPKNIINEGVADEVLSPEKMIDRIIELGK